MLFGYWRRHKEMCHETIEKGYESRNQCKLCTYIHLMIIIYLFKYQSTYNSLCKIEFETKQDIRLKRSYDIIELL